MLIHSNLLKSKVNQQAKLSNLLNPGSLKSGIDELDMVN